MPILRLIDKRFWRGQNQCVMNSSVTFSRVRSHFCWLLLVVGATSAGCGGSGSAPSSGPDSTGAVPRVATPPRHAAQSDEPPPSPEKATAAPEPPRPVGPWLQWQVAQAPVVEGKSFLTLMINHGSESVVQLASYDTPEHEEFPSLFVRALTKATSVRELLNQKLPAQLYLQVERQGNLLHNLPDQSVELMVTAIEGTTVRGTFGGQVHDVDTGGNGPIHGSFQVVLETGVD